MANIKWPKKSLIILIILVMITPLGILAEGEAWGEWDISEWPVPDSWKSVAISLADIWKAPLPDYNLPGWREGILPYIGYIISAFIGVSLLLVITYFIGYIVAKGREHV